MSTKVMTIDDLRPDPRPIMDQMAAEAEKSSLIFGYTHGSMLYRPTGSLVGGYQEVRVFDPALEQVVRIDYLPKAQPPDIDIIAVVKDKKVFREYFDELVKEHKLDKDINYFFTLNVSDPDTHEAEITSPWPRAYKRILACRPTKGFGDLEEYERAKKTAEKHIGPLDQAFQKDLLARKEMMTSNVENGHKPFSVTAEEFAIRFPIFFVNLHTYFGDFEESRDKFVQPCSMDIKGKQYLDSDHIEPIR